MNNIPLGSIVMVDMGKLAPFIGKVGKNESVGKVIGKVVSVFGSDQLTGPTYIIEDLSGTFPNDLYPYTHYACFGQFLSPGVKLDG